MILTREMFQRRVPHFLALYLGVSWGIVQFITFLEDRYGISPHLTDLALLGFALLIPSVLLFTYNHGKPGADKAPRSEPFGIAVNLALAAGVLFSVFHDKPLGSVITSVTTTDEGGQTVERSVARASFRKRIALFNFDDTASDTATSWLRYGLPLGIAVDLSQDMFVDLRTSAYFREKLRQLGYREEVNVPVSLKRRIASEQHLPYFTDAKLSRAGDQLSVDLSLYETARGDLVQRRTYASADVFALVDQITAGIKRDLDIPQTSKTVDMKASEVLTPSLPAFREFVDGAVAAQVNDKWQQAAAHFEKATQHDPSFAYAWLSLHSVYVYSNQAQSSMPPLQKALDHVYRLPERMQYDVKAEYYMMKQDKDRAYAVARMKVDLFPEDLAGYLLLAQFQRMRNDRDGTIASIRKIYDLDPSQQERLRELGSLFEAKGEFDEALRYYTQYAERFPDKHEAFLSIGNLQRQQGDHTKARENYDKAMLLAPAEVAPQLALARLDRDLGNFDAARRQYEEALAGARTGEDRVRALDGLAEFYQFRGQQNRSLEYTEQSIAASEKIGPPLAVTFARLRSVSAYVRAGKTAAANQLQARVSAQLQPPLNLLSPLGEMELQLELERPDDAERAATRLEQSIQTLGFQFLEPTVVNARARVAELRGKCDQAIPLYEQQRKLQPSDASIHLSMGRCYRKLGQPARSIEQLQGWLRVVPHHGRGNYELALAYLAAGDRPKALEHLRRAQQTWSEADATLREAAEVSQKMKEMR